MVTYVETRKKKKKKTHKIDNGKRKSAIQTNIVLAVKEKKIRVPTNVVITDKDTDCDSDANLAQLCADNLGRKILIENKCDSDATLAQLCADSLGRDFPRKVTATLMLLKLSYAQIA